MVASVDVQKKSSIRCLSRSDLSDATSGDSVQGRFICICSFQFGWETFFHIAVENWVLLEAVTSISVVLYISPPYFCLCNRNGILTQGVRIGYDTRYDTRRHLSWFLPSSLVTPCCLPPPSFTLKHLHLHLFHSKHAKVGQGYQHGHLSRGVCLQASLQDLVCPAPRYSHV